MFWLDFSNTGFKLGNFDFPYFILIALLQSTYTVDTVLCANSAIPLVVIYDFKIKADIVYAMYGSDKTMKIDYC